jgi:hypothetical protein
MPTTGSSQTCAMPTVPAQSSERLTHKIKIIVQIQSPLHSSGL